MSMHRGQPITYDKFINYNYVTYILLGATGPLHVIKLFDSLDWLKISEIIRGAKSRVIYVAAGLDDAVATALVDAHSRLGPQAVSIVLDIEPESFRLGYGIFEAVTMLKEKGVIVRMQKGLRIGFVAADQDAWSFTMPPLLVESSDDEYVNAFRLTREQTDAAIVAVGFQRNHANNANEAQIGLQTMDTRFEGETKQALDADPPQRFDISRKVRVFNSKVEFVELEIKGHQIQRCRVTLPKDLVVAIDDPSVRNRINAMYRVIDDAAVVGGDKIDNLVAEMRKTYLKSIPEYGSVILRTSRAAFEKEFEDLKVTVKDFKSTILECLSKQIDDSIQRLVDAFLPGVMRNPPKHLCAQVSQVTEDKARQWIAQRVRQVFPSAEDLISRMSLKCIFKGVTYEVLSDAKFQEAIKRLLPYEDWDTPLTEFDAAPGALREIPFGIRHPAK